MRQHKLWLCTLLVLLLAALGAFGAAAETTVGMSGAGSFKMEQVYVNVPELDVYFYALDGDGNSYSPIKVQAAGPELTLGDRRLEVRSVAAASDPICYILALDNSKSITPSEFYTMLGGVRKLINAMTRRQDARAVAVVDQALAAIPSQTVTGLNWGAVVTAGSGQSNASAWPAADFAKVQLLADTQELGVEIDNVYFIGHGS